PNRSGFGFFSIPAANCLTRAFIFVTRISNRVWESTKAAGACQVVVDFLESGESKPSQAHESRFSRLGASASGNNSLRASHGAGWGCPLLDLITGELADPC